MRTSELLRRGADTVTRIEDVIEKEIDSGIAFGPFHRMWQLQKAPEKVQRYLRLAKEHPHFMATRQSFAGMDIGDAPTAAFNARNTSASELNILGDTINSVCPQAIINQFCALPANDARPGKVYEMRFGAIYSNTSTPTVLFTPRWGSSTTVATNISLGASGTFTTITSTTNLPIYGELTIVVRTAPPGASLATVYATGSIDLGIPVTSSQFCSTLYWGGGTAATTVDASGQATAGCGLTANVTWGTSSASNTLTTQWFMVRSLN